MYIEPFWAGVLVTIFVELSLVVSALFFSYLKFTSKKK